MVNVTMLAPAGAGGVVQGPAGQIFQPDANGQITVDARFAAQMLGAGYRFSRTGVVQADFSSALPADLISIVAAATPANGAPVIAAQPPHARKLQYRIVLGTPGTTNITAGTATTVGTDQDGNPVTEVISLVTAVSVTLKSAFAWSKITSFTIAGYVASGSGTGNTFGVGLSNDFGIPTSQGQVFGFAIVKASKTTKVLGTSNVTADDVAATATVDAVARTVAPTTAPAANGLVDYSLVCSYGLAD